MAALGWGVADFLARFAARRVGAYRTMFFMQGLGFLGLTAWMAVAGAGEFLHGGGGPAWWLAVVVGLLNAGSGLALYRSFEVGVLSVVAPISASYPALTLLLAIRSGETIGPMRAAGMGAILAGVILAATSLLPESNAEPRSARGKRHLARGVGWAIASSLGFGTVFWLLGFHVMPVLGGVVSVWAVRLTSFCVLGLLAAPVRQSIRPPRGRVWWFIAGVALLDTAAFVANNLGLKTGQVSLVTVLASLYSAVTVLLARLFLRERMGWTQWLGIALIFAGIALVSL